MARILCWLLIFVCGCTPAPERVVFDFATSFPQAEQSAVRTPRLDFGSWEAMVHQKSGWGELIRTQNPNLRRSLGPGSAVDFDLSRPAALRLTFRCASPEPQQLMVTVNGNKVQELSLTGDLWEYTVEVAEEAVKAGSNRLTFDHDSAKAVDWDWLEIEEPWAVAAERREQTLVLPVGARLDYYLTVPPRSHLVWEELSGDLELRVTGELVASQTHQLTKTSPTRTPLAEARVARVTLIATSPVRLKGLKLVSPTAIPEPGRRPAAGRPPIIVYMIDTLRARNLGCYGYPEDTSPHLDAFAEDSVRFSNCSSQASFTKSAVASLFTGRWPAAHRTELFRAALPPEEVTLAERLKELDYQTFGISANAFIHERFGMTQGFDQYFAETHLPTATLVDDTLEWLDQRPSTEQPFFLYLHSMDPHLPYLPSDQFRRRFAPEVDPKWGDNRVLWTLDPDPEVVESVGRLYDAEVATADEQFGRFLAELRRRDLYDEALIVVLSDHGEELQDHGSWGHSSTLHSELLHVPLLVKYPNGRGAGTVVEESCALVDLLPTVMDYLGEDPPAGVNGRTLLQGRRGADPVFSSLRLRKDDHRRNFLWLRHKRAVTVEGYKFIWNEVETALSPAVMQLYDLKSDPGEVRNLVSEQPLWTGYGLSLLKLQKSIEREGLMSPNRDFTEQQIRSLDYLR